MQGCLIDPTNFYFYIIIDMTFGYFRSGLLHFHIVLFMPLFYFFEFFEREFLVAFACCCWLVFECHLYFFFICQCWILLDIYFYCFNLVVRPLFSSFVSSSCSLSVSVSCTLSCICSLYGLIPNTNSYGVWAIAR